LASVAAEEADLGQVVYLSMTEYCDSGRPHQLSVKIGSKSFINRREQAFQAVGGDTEVSENRLPLTPLFAFASRHCCPAAPAETGSICSAYVVCLFRIIRLFEAVEELRETGLQY
jgi:hypothetical protein